ncbi:family 43 glycosylhydrolase [Parapedobacter koreensis]|uniref:Glycosyl hydrolases family 43 n=1 Tax=Parapedobacter koreensis TaxID=332977 RepID=A0A1H7RM94_9SPHI|nr:family 43 glycosylhydrolase [Parapedobacter koreensis]SEL61159.1 Glycosyl hydrolases family 43 [Parapedobacter koreensis]
MIRRITCSLLLVGLHVLHLPAQEKRELFFADPTIYVADGKYYLTGTGGNSREAPGFFVLVSDDLKTWAPPAGARDSAYLILAKGDQAFGTEGFWAPQLLKAKDTYYLTYTANEQTVLAQSSALPGPYRQKEVAPIDGAEKNIDSYIFNDDDGKYYLYHVRFDDGNYLWVAEFDLEKGKIKPETLKKCFGQTEPWEATPAYESSPIMEGPTVIKLKGKYYLFYSANHFRNIDYAVGYAVADSPYGPWIKQKGSPILHRTIVGENGSGHGDLFEGLDGQLYYVYHVHFGQQQVSPRKTRIVPITMQWDPEAGLYTFSVNSEEIIEPVLADAGRGVSPPARKEGTYTNPVFEPILADPSVIRDPQSGLFYAYGTQDDWGDGQGSRLVPILQSANLVDWQVVGQAFSSKPAWKSSGGIWAPDANYVDGRYYLYYAYSTWGDPNPGVGVAVADKPIGPFADRGKLFTSEEVDVPNSIDPFFMEEAGEKHVFWGSFSDAPTQGTYGIRLADDGLSVPDLSRKVKIAAGDYEAVMIHKRDGYYYFFGSKGSCCEGANSQYHVLVARSAHLMGPYLDKEGRAITERGNGTLFIKGNELFVGPGHNARLIADDEGTDWFIYHGIDRSKGTVPTGASRRMLMLDRVIWRDGWPELADGTPSAKPQQAPVFQ